MFVAVDSKFSEKNKFACALLATELEDLTLLATDDDATDATLEDDLLLLTTELTTEELETATELDALLVDVLLEDVTAELLEELAAHVLM